MNFCCKYSVFCGIIILLELFYRFFCVLLFTILYYNNLITLKPIFTDICLYLTVTFSLDPDSGKLAPKFCERNFIGVFFLICECFLLFFVFHYMYMILSQTYLGSLTGKEIFFTSFIFIRFYLFNFLTFLFI